MANDAANGVERALSVTTASQPLLADVRTEVGQAIDRQTRWTVTFIAGWSTLVVVAARLLV